MSPINPIKAAHALCECKAGRPTFMNWEMNRKMNG
jgi:hypothetical protein